MGGWVVRGIHFDIWEFHGSVDPSCLLASVAAPTLTSRWRYIKENQEHQGLWSHWNVPPHSNPPFTVTPPPFLFENESGASQTDTFSNCDFLHATEEITEEGNPERPTWGFHWNVTLGFFLPPFFFFSFSFFKFPVDVQLKGKLSVCTCMCTIVCMSFFDWWQLYASFNTCYMKIEMNTTLIYCSQELGCCSSWVFSSHYVLHNF